MSEIKIIPSAQPVKKTAERPSFSNTGAFQNHPKAPFAFESSRTPIKLPAR